MPIHEPKKTMRMMPRNNLEYLTPSFTREVIRKIEDLPREVRQFEFELSCNGGDIEEGFKIYEALRNFHGLVTCNIIKAYSMAVIIAQGAKRRRIYWNGRMMIHEPLITLYDHSLTDSYAHLEGARKDHKRMCEILAERSGKSARFWEKIREDEYFNAGEALKLGLVDEIIPSVKKEVEEQ